MCRHGMSCGPREAFTLIEMPVVIASIAISAGILFLGGKTFSVCRPLGLPPVPLHVPVPR